MTNNYDIKLLNNKREIERVFWNFDVRGLHILFTKVLINLKLGQSSFFIPYDTAFTSNRNELLLLLNEKDQEKFIKKLDEMNISFHEVDFQEETYEYKPPQDNKKIVFVRGLKSLRETLEDSKRHNRNECIYYPRVNGKLNLKYYLRDDTKEELISKEVKGLIEFNDRIILCLKQEEARNINYRKALNLFDELDITVSISDETEFNSIRKEKEFIKK